MAFNLTHTVALPIILARRTMVQSTGTNSGWDQYYNTIEFGQWGSILLRAIDVMEWYPMGYKFVLIWCSPNHTLLSFSLASQGPPNTRGSSSAWLADLLSQTGVDVPDRGEVRRCVK